MGHVLRGTLQRLSLSWSEPQKPTTPPVKKRVQESPRRLMQDAGQLYDYDGRGVGSTLKGDLFLLAIVSGFEGPTHTLERALPQVAELALPHHPTHTV